jgi:hypothetical protein
MYNKIIINITATPSANLTARVWLVFYAILLAFPAEKWYNENNKIFQEGRLYGRIRPFCL